MHSQIDFLKKIATKKIKIPRIIPFIFLLFFILFELFLSFPFPMFFFVFGYFSCRAFFRRTTVSLMAFIAIVLFFILSYQIRYKLDIYNGNKIATAIESYHQTNNSYPEKLKDLVPEHIDSIPFNWTGYHHWHYWKNKKREGYTLLFLPYGFMKCAYNSQEKTWHCRD